MGYDVTVQIIHGFKIPLSEAFKLDILDSDILESDDYQLIDEPDCKEEIIKNHVKSEDILKIINKGWDITSSQEDADPESSYMFLYDKNQIICSGKIPDYETGVVDNNQICEHNFRSYEYKIHWIVESSY